MRGRLFWLLVGGAVTYVVLHRLGVVRSSPQELASRAARQVGARAGDGVVTSAGNAIAAARDFGAQVRAHAGEREAELRAAVAPADDETRPAPHSL